jgi:hypothetical protein
MAFTMITAALATAGCTANADSQAPLSISAPEARSARSAPPASEVEAWQVNVPEGTVIEARLDRSLDSSRTRVGETFTATVYRDVLVEGRRAIPAGSTLHGIVKRSISVNRGTGNASLALAFNSIELPDENSVAMVASFSGQIVTTTHHAAAVLGGAAEGGAGIGVVTARGGEQVKLPAGSSVSLRLDQPVQVPRRT